MKYEALVGLEYPDKRSQETIKKAGGVPKMTAEQRAKLKTKTVKAGSFCDDVPESAVKLLLKQGSIRELATRAPLSSMESSTSWTSPKRVSARKKQE